MALRVPAIGWMGGGTALKAAGGFCVVLAVVGSLAFASAERAYRAGRIAQGVTIADIAVGRMTEGEALQALETMVRPKLAGPVSLTHGGDSWVLTRAQLGVTLDLEASVADAMKVGHTGGRLRAWRERRRAAREGLDVPLRVSVDYERLGLALEELQGQVEREPRPAEVEFDRATQQVSVRPDVPGRKLDIEATRDAVVTTLANLATSSVELVVSEERAAVTAEDLRSIDCVLGSYTTKYNAGEASRAHNIALAAASLNGCLVGPGQRLSYNEVVGERTKDRGFQMAHVYEEGEVRDGIGGGICQVSTTLYNAALLSGLKIVSRRPHMMPVAYIPTGRDATVDWTSGIDLVIENNTAHPIYLVSFAGGGSITCIFLGSQSDKPESVEIIRSGSAELGFETIEKRDGTKPVGWREVEKKGRKGYKVTVHRVIKWPGKEPVKEWLSSDTYPKQNEVIILGPASAESEAGPALPGPKAPTKASGTKSAPAKSTPEPAPEERSADLEVEPSKADAD